MTCTLHLDSMNDPTDLDANPADDPRPTPPERPLLEDCCQSGCSPCIFDLYEEALDRYEAQLRAWEARHAGSPGERDR
jgi:hypothetical protein